MLAKRDIDRIVQLEEAGKKLPQADLRLVDRFVGALYVRQIIIPAGVMITSRVYKRTYVDIMISGNITITDTNGTYDLKGYNVLEGTAGRKRVGFAHEDTIWLTVHDCVDIKTDDPESDISFETLDQYQEHRCEIAKIGYQRFQTESKLLTADTQKATDNAVTEVTGDFTVYDSPIHGKGIFAKRRFVSGECVGRVEIDGNKTTLCQYLNHSDYPNAIIYNSELIVTQPMDTGHELTVNYSHNERLFR